MQYFWTVNSITKNRVRSRVVAVKGQDARLGIHGVCFFFVGSNAGGGNPECHLPTLYLTRICLVGDFVGNTNFIHHCLGEKLSATWNPSIKQANPSQGINCGPSLSEYINHQRGVMNFQWTCKRCQCVCGNSREKPPQMPTPPTNCGLIKGLNTIDCPLISWVMKKIYWLFKGTVHKGLILATYVGIMNLSKDP